VKPTDVKGPLASLQLTQFTRDDFLRLFKTINTSLGENKLQEPVVTQVFEKWWPDLEKRVAELMNSAPQPKPRKRELEEIVEETLLLVRSIRNSLDASSRQTETPAALQRLRKYIALRGADTSASLSLLSLLNEKFKEDTIDSFSDSLLRSLAETRIGIKSEDKKNDPTEDEK
jgi:hypothetical protein